MDRAGGTTDGGLHVVAGLLAPGKVIGDGRYRLLTRTGVDERENAHLWRAWDGYLNQDVALTVLIGESTNAGVAARARRTLERCVHLAGIAHSGVAQVLNVLSVGDGIAASEGIVGLVVSEWTPGTDLVDLAAGQRLPLATICQVLDPLAAAMEHAHHRAVVLGISHPRRIRLTPEGGLRLAFPGPPPDASPDDDVHGLGALLYLLLTGRSPNTPAGAILAPQVLLPEVPGKLSDVAVHSLEVTTPGRIRTSATIRQALRQAAEDVERTDALSPVPDEPPEPDDGQIWVTKRPVNDPVRKRKLALAVTALMLASLAVVAWMGATMADFFKATPHRAQGEPSVSVTEPVPSPVPTTPVNPAPQPAEQVAPRRVEVFNLSGDADSASTPDRAIDGDPATSWRTDAYFQQFPAFKPGIGLLVSFAQPMNLTTLSITSPSTGTHVEIRIAPSANPHLSETDLVGTATLTAGITTIDLPQPKPTQYILIWITRLAGTDQHFQSALDELTFTAK
jgi:hypothetical protein